MTINTHERACVRVWCMYVFVRVVGFDFSRTYHNKIYVPRVCVTFVQII